MKRTKQFVSVFFFLDDETFALLSKEKDLSVKSRARALRFLIALTKGSRSICQPLNSLRWPIYVFNSVDNTKLPYFLAHYVMVKEMTRNTQGNQPRTLLLVQDLNVLNIEFFTSKCTASDSGSRHIHG